MAYDQHSQYQPPSRPYYSRNAPEPAPQPYNASYGQAGYNEQSNGDYDYDERGYMQGIDSRIPSKATVPSNYQSQAQHQQDDWHTNDQGAGQLGGWGSVEHDQTRKGNQRETDDSYARGYGQAHDNDRSRHKDEQRRMADGRSQQSSASSNYKTREPPQDTSKATSWDNPFPVFGKKSLEGKRKEDDGDRSLNEAMANTNVSARKPLSRPGTSNSKRSQGSADGRSHQYADAGRSGHPRVADPADFAPEPVTTAYEVESPYEPRSAAPGSSANTYLRQPRYGQQQLQEPHTAPVSPADPSFRYDQPQPQRSMTMPNEVAGYKGPAGPSYRQGSDRNGYTNGNTPPTSHASTDRNGGQYKQGNSTGGQYGSADAHTHSQKHDSFDVLDSYYGNSAEPFITNQEEHVPNHSSAGSPGYHNGSGTARGTGYAAYPSSQVSRSRSQPDLRHQNPGSRGGPRGYDRDAPDVPPMKRPSPSNQYGGGRRPPPGQGRDPYSDPYRQGAGAAPRSPMDGGRGGYPPRGRGGPPGRGGIDSRGHRPNDRAGGRPYPPGPPRSHGPPDPHRGIPRPRGGPPPNGQDPRALGGRRPSGRDAASQNPDALPAHPTPVRPGLVPGSTINQPSDPSPIREGSDRRPTHTSRSSGGSKHSFDRRASQPAVTFQELEEIQRTVRQKPGDQANQLLLAKKWVEAAAVLANDGGRADARTEARNREKYILDADKLVRKLVGQGYSEAMFYLADCYGEGNLGLRADHKEAFSLYQSAAKLGHAQAAYRTAVSCEIGVGATKDPMKAIQWYKRAAALGDTPAMYKMGMIQLQGLLGQPKNPREALVWLKRAAERADEENPHALHQLGLWHINAGPNDIVLRDEPYARQLFFQAAEFGYKPSQFRLGEAHEYGLMGCPVDARTSIAWYSKAAVQEEHQSELALSGWYLTGSEGIMQQNDQEAYLWARKAAQAGLSKAEYAMGYFTEVGIGCPPDLEQAKTWYQRAAGQGFPKARQRLDDLRRGGAKAQKSRERLSRSNVKQHNEGDCVIM